MPTSLVLRSALFAMFCCSINAAQAGDPKAEADRCTRWLNAFFQGQLDQAVSTMTEQLKQGEVPQTYYEGQFKRISKLYRTVTALGGGPPISASPLSDVEVEETGDIIRRQAWTFKNGSSNVGCVDHPGQSVPWHFTVLFGDNPDELLQQLESAAKSRDTGSD